ncbi:hypothetical protein [Micromonospora rubida]|uniref:hypothetical protein n=1 Tax=Micromonospora rubida TaxID=2697657 RepID=UPI001378FE81|nr:hypothetical protein [Micromonospora rubida]NBE80129.1 hypothetical protein [Micromonospora rubida]
MDVDLSPDTARGDDRDEVAEANLHVLLLRLAGTLQDGLLTDIRGWLAEGRRRDVAQALAFEAVSQPLQLAGDEIELLRVELIRGGAGTDLALALEELRGERPSAPWLFRSALPTGADEAGLVVRPLDRTGEPPEGLDAVERALVAEASGVPGMRAVWHSWRMPSNARPWQEPVRVAVVSVDDTLESMPSLTVRLRRVMAGAGDADAQVEVCWAGLDVPFYQTLARSCGALLWASRPAAPITTARVFDGVDPVRGPWFTTNRPVIADGAERDQLIAALSSAVVITWSSAQMADVLAPERGDIVPLHLRTDGSWVWSDAVTYYLENYGLAPDPDLAAHLGGPGLAEPAEPLDEISVHRALVHLFDGRSGEAVWQPPDPGEGPLDPDQSSDPPNPWRSDEPAGADPETGAERPVQP